MHNTCQLRDDDISVDVIDDNPSLHDLSDIADNLPGVNKRNGIACLF